MPLLFFYTYILESFAFFSLFFLLEGFAFFSHFFLFSMLIRFGSRIDVPNFANKSVLISRKHLTTSKILAATTQIVLMALAVVEDQTTTIRAIPPMVRMPLAIQMVMLAMLLLAIQRTATTALPQQQILMVPLVVIINLRVI